MPTTPTPFLALYTRTGSSGPAGGAGIIEQYVYGSSGSPPGGIYDHFCPTRDEDGTPNFDPTSGAWFDTEYPSPNAVALTLSNGTIIGYLEPNDARVGWDSAYANYYAADAGFSPPGTCAGVVLGLGYPTPTSALLFQNDFEAQYPNPSGRAGVTADGFGVFYCPDVNAAGMGGGGGDLGQTPALVYRQLDPGEADLAIAFPDPDYWWTCNYCPDGFVYDPNTGICEDDTSCPPGEMFCSSTGLCTPAEFPASCSDERGCVWNAVTCTVDCTPIDEMCPPGQIFNEATCGCDDVPTPGVMGAGTWYHDIRVKVQVDRNDLFLPTGDRELHYSFVGQRPLIETVSLTPLAHTQIFPPAQAVAMVLEPEGAVLIRLKGRGGDIGTNITPAAPVASIPAFVPLDPAGVNLWLYNGATYTQTVRVRWLRTLQPEEEEPI